MIGHTKHSPFKYLDKWGFRQKSSQFECEIIGLFCRANSEHIALFWTLLNLPNNSLILVDILMGDTFHTKSSWKWHLTSKKMPQFLNKKYRRKHTRKVTHQASPRDERNQNKFPLCDNSHYYSGRNKNAELELKKMLGSRDQEHCQLKIFSKRHLSAALRTNFANGVH